MHLFPVSVSSASSTSPLHQRSPDLPSLSPARFEPRHHQHPRRLGPPPRHYYDFSTPQHLNPLTPTPPQPSLSVYPSSPCPCPTPFFSSPTQVPVSQPLSPVVGGEGSGNWDPPHYLDPRRSTGWGKDSRFAELDQIWVPDEVPGRVPMKVPERSGTPHGTCSQLPDGCQTPATGQDGAVTSPVTFTYSVIGGLSSHRRDPSRRTRERMRRHR
jgi:hypothetical protein